MDNPAVGGLEALPAEGLSAPQAAERGLGGMPMVPLGAAHPGGQGAARERTTWLTEDEDVWGADSDAPPAVLGALAPGTSSHDPLAGLFGGMR